MQEWILTPIFFFIFLWHFFIPSVDPIKADSTEISLWILLDVNFGNFTCNCGKNPLPISFGIFFGNSFGNLCIFFHPFLWKIYEPIGIAEGIFKRVSAGTHHGHEISVSTFKGILVGIATEKIPKEFPKIAWDVPKLPKNFQKKMV